MEIKIEIPDEEIKETLKREIARAYYSDYSSDRNHVNRVVAEQVRKIIYEDKERIVDRIVAQASRECKNKAIKKIIETIGGEE